MEPVNNPVQIFNSPLEVGLRAVFILSSVKEDVSLQKLVYLDFLLTKEMSKGREFLKVNDSVDQLRRNLISQGLDLMLSRGLVVKHFMESGITYGPSDITKPFLSYFESEYARDLRTHLKSISRYLKYSEQQLYDKLKVANKHHEFEFLGDQP